MLYRMRKRPEIVYIMTDMEGIAGIDHWDQCYHPDDDAPEYLYGRAQLTADSNAAIAGCFDAGVREVRICDGHGRNQFRGFLPELDARATQVRMHGPDGILSGLDDEVAAVVVVGQHAMAGTIGGFLDHTQIPRQICRLLINGEEHGELSQLALYAGHFGVPVVHVSGDEALCAESRRLFPGASTTPTKRGTGWDTCELYPLEEVRLRLREETAAALRRPLPEAWRLPLPVDVAIEWAWSGPIDGMAKVPGVARPHARVASWRIGDLRDIFQTPSEGWSPLRQP